MNRMASIPKLSGGAMVLGFMVLVPGALLYLTRPEAALSPTRLSMERGFIIAAVVFTAVGLVLLKEHLTGKAAHPWALIGAYLYLFGAILIVTAEALGLSGIDSTHGLVVTYVVLALVAEMSVGVAVVHSDMQPSLIGWATIAWNVTWLIILVFALPSGIYVPVLHHLMPLAIGSALIVDGGGKRAAA